GKVGVPVEILEFPGKLSAQAMRVMRTHVDITGAILADSFDPVITQIALRHHEKLDGSGYQRGLMARDLTIPERIVAVSDIVSALYGTRSYKESFPKEKTLHIIQKQSGEGLIDKTVVAVISDNFDSIMETVKERCKPVWELYHKMQDEYRRLMEQYAGTALSTSAGKTDFA
ncbi:HD-GYP domain-containing protein, partial [Christensenella hongkongensis]